MWNLTTSSGSSAFAEFSSTIYCPHQPVSHSSCPPPTLFFKLMFQNIRSFSVPCWKASGANHVASRSEHAQISFSQACGTLFPHVWKARPLLWMLKRKACSVQGTEPSSIGFRVPMVCEDCGPAQKYLPETNPGKEESVVCEDATTLRPTSAAKVFKQNGREGGHFPVAEEKSRFEQEKCASYGPENRSVGTEACEATSGVIDLQTSRENGHDKDMGKNAAQGASGQQPAKYEKELKVALRAVQLACMLTQRIQDRLLRHEESATAKNDRSLVTIADWGVQAVVSWVLSQAFPDECLSIVAEEDTESLEGLDGIHLLHRVVAAVNECLTEASVAGVLPPNVPLATVDVLNAIRRGDSEGGPKGRHWVLDPVDGTLGFVRGDQYAVALALIDDGQVMLGLLGCPNFPMRREWLKYEHKYYRLLSKFAPPSPKLWHKGCVMTAIKGGGKAWMEPLIWGPVDLNKYDDASPLAVHVSNVTDPSEAAFCEPVEKGNSSHQLSAGVASSIGLRLRPLRIYSMAKYAAIARGDAEIFMKFAKVGYREKIWDHAAGVLIVEEAGGVVTDARGRPLDFSRGRYLEGLDRGIIASAGKVLHSKIIAAVDDSWSSSTL